MMINAASPSRTRPVKRQVRLFRAGAGGAVAVSDEVVAFIVAS
jgi:hypothetical protein